MGLQAYKLFLKRHVLLNLVAFFILFLLFFGLTMHFGKRYEAKMTISSYVGNLTFEHKEQKKFLFFRNNNTHNSSFNDFFALVYSQRLAENLLKKGVFSQKAFTVADLQHWIFEHVYVLKDSATDFYYMSVFSKDKEIAKEMLALLYKEVNALFVMDQKHIMFKHQKHLQQELEQTNSIYKEERILQKLDEIELRLLALNTDFVLGRRVDFSVSLYPAFRQKLSFLFFAFFQAFLGVFIFSYLWFRVKK